MSLGRLALVTAVVAATACSKEPAPAAPAPASAKRNLVLITLDTTRADHLGCYGHTAAVTPNLDALSRDGATCDRAFAVAPLTLPSHVSLLTSLYPPRHGVRDNVDFRLPDSETTLAEHLKAQGFASSASVGTYILAGELGLSQGFDRYDEPVRTARGAVDASSIRLERVVERAAPLVISDAIDAVSRMKDGPFFLWVQLYDPHTPYVPQPSLAQNFAGRMYDGEIALVDAQLGRLFDHLRAHGLFDRTVIAVTADHGESLGEHGEDTHGVLLYDSTLRVPVIVRAPGTIKPGTRFAGLVSGVDVAPTLLELLGLPPLPGAQGRSVAAALTGGTVPEREPVYAESLFGARAYGWAPLHALRSASEKYIAAPEAELYDLEADAGETTNLASKRLGPASAWREKLGRLANDMGASNSIRPNPNKIVAVSNLFLKAQQEVGAGRTAAAAVLLERALAQDPQNPAVASLLGALRYVANERGAGLAQLRAAAKASPGIFEYQWNLGNALFLEKKYQEGAAAYRAAIAIRPHAADAHYALANVLAAAGDAPGAVGEYNEAIRRGLRTAPVLAALGTTLSQSGDIQGAEAALRAAVDADPNLADGWNHLGILLDKSGRRPEALAAFAKALAAQPDHADALFNRAKLELLLEDLPAARADLDRLLAAHPGYHAGAFLQAHLCVAEGNVAGARDALTKFLAMSGSDPKMKAAAEDMLRKL